MSRLRIVTALLVACVAICSPARAAEETASSVPLAGTLRDATAWTAWKARFVTDGGRVVDTGNQGISHSEGQGFGMLLAVAANDRPTFERIWGWTRANLMVRDDQLLAWRWEPGKRPAVADMNNAADGDILVAWALTEAAEAWRDPAHRAAGRRIAVEVGRKLIVPKTDQGAILLPGVAGFAAEDRADGPVINASYWVFPAFERLPIVAGEFDWTALSRSGLALLSRASANKAKLPSDWTTLKGPGIRPADGVPATFGYDAVRIPLYLAMAGLRSPVRDGVKALQARRESRGVPILDVGSLQPKGWFAEPGYDAVLALAACASDATPIPASVRAFAPQQNYYPATLHLLALVALQTRQPQCAPRS